MDEAIRPKILALLDRTLTLQRLAVGWRIMGWAWAQH